METTSQNYDLVLHIGRHKTGTTATQRALTNSEAELERCGFYYPKPPTHYFAHHELAAPLSRRAAGTVIPIESILDSRSVLTPIVSSEDFQNCNPRLVKDWLGNRKVLVVVYLREQYEYARSAFCQAVQAQSIHKSFDEYCTEFQPDYGRFVSLWMERFGESNVRVRVYDPDVLVGRSIVTDFASVLSPRLQLANQGRANPSIGGVLLAFKLLVNRLPIEPDVLLKLSYDVLADVSRMRSEYSTKPTLAFENVLRYQARFSESNSKALAYAENASYFPATDRGLADEPLVFDVEQFAQVWLDIVENGGELLLELVCEHEERWESHHDEKSVLLSAARVAGLSETVT